jgi:hypothetical protein
MIGARRIVFLVAMAGVFAVVLNGCSTKPAATSGAKPSAAPPTEIATQPTDYADAKHWLHADTKGDLPVDVFYLYPTAYFRETADLPNICAVDNPGMVKGAQSAFARQATAFEGEANIFAPYYRQADALHTLSLSLAEREQVVGGIPTSDALAAFEYYLQHYNQGRPFIMAGHSQGSNVLLYLLADYMRKHPDIYKRMVAAYVIGYSVTPAYLAQNRHLRFAEGPDDTGVIVSWNTEAPKIGGKNLVVLPGALAINPITWTRLETTATAKQNLGSIALNPDGSVKTDAAGKPARVADFADAHVDLARGVVICSTAPVDTLAPGNAVLPRGVYHSFDYPFYYFDIKANAANRIARYLAK